MVTIHWPILPYLIDRTNGNSEAQTNLERLVKTTSGTSFWGYRRSSRNISSESSVMFQRKKKSGMDQNRERSFGQALFQLSRKWSRPCPEDEKKKKNICV